MPSRRACSAPRTSTRGSARLPRLLLERRCALARAFALDACIVPSLTGGDGCGEDPRGIDLPKALRLADAGVPLESCGRGISRPAPEYILQARADIVIELTPL